MIRVTIRVFEMAAPTAHHPRIPHWNPRPNALSYQPGRPPAARPSRYKIADRNAREVYMALSAWKSPLWHSEELVNLEALRQQLTRRVAIFVCCASGVAIWGTLAQQTTPQTPLDFERIERIRAEHWKTSALRDSVIGLVEGGLSMIAGGYRQLLRHRRQR